MTKQSDIFYERADAAAVEAGQAKLTNVRDRALRSEAAWRQMADRALLIEEERARAAGARITE